MKNFTQIKMKNCLYTVLFMSGVQLGMAQCPTVVWGDEFSGNTLDGTKWNYQTGTGCAEGICGWGNNELQYYKQENISVSNGTLKITAIKENQQGSAYTSGRINSSGKGDFTYGRFEASIKLPDAHGLWPAFWMLSTNEPYGGWPQSGEIDIMEFVASNPDEIFGTIHYGDPYPNNQYQGNGFTLHSGTFPEAFHEFAIEWEPGEIRWFLDGVLYSVKRVEDVVPYNWPFDQDFHFLLNVAVGGNLGGAVNNAMLPATMEVDYVRVYDGFKAYLSGNRVVANQAQGEDYTIGNVPANTNVTWSVPAGATIISGQGTETLTVDFGAESGLVSASFNNGCENQVISVFVEVEAAYTRAFSFENFDDPATATFSLATGTLNEVANPSPDAVNGSALSGEYTRNSGEQYDVLVYSVNNITDASQYVEKEKKFYMDVYTNAPIGTDILLQLETSGATPTNYPTGRHSRYVGTVTENNTWHRLKFTLLDRPDPGASDTGVTTMILLFASNSFTGDTYYFDNLDSYTADTGGTPQEPASVHVNSVVTGTAGAGKGSKYGTATVSIVDDLGSPVAGASVSGTFSGSYNEQVNGVTGANGVVVLQTQGTQKGAVTVNFCVDNVTATLPYDVAANVTTCAQGAAKSAPGTETEAPGVTIYPNPAVTSLHITTGDFIAPVTVTVFDMNGRILSTRTLISAEEQIDVSALDKGIYIVKIQDAENRTKTVKLIK